MNGLLRFIACGSVDDGKSTLIGHLLYDAKLLYADQEKALELDSKAGSRGGAIDYSLLLDGLAAEREQGITIDVAYRYFTTERRSFIVADAPGHEEYTRNMAVGASFADLAVILVDAKLGVLVQTRRHARICVLMGIRHFVFAVNKMDLINYSEASFLAIEAQVQKLAEELRLEHITIIPVSATEGDNVTEKSERIPWYKGEALLAYLENVEISKTTVEEGFYMPVQRVCRPSHDFRGFQGQIEAGVIKVGDLLTALPSKEKAHVKNVRVGDREVGEAFAGQPVTIQLEREVDVSRGCVLTQSAGLKTSSALTAAILWMDDDPLSGGKNFLVKNGTKLILGVVKEICHSIDVNTGEQKTVSVLKKNEIAVCSLTLAEKIVVDEFRRHKTLGEIILIDRLTHRTSACGVITDSKASKQHPDQQPAKPEIRAALKGQVPIAVEFGAKNSGFDKAFVEKTERLLISAGKHTYLYAPKQNEAYGDTVRHLVKAGIIVLLYLDRNMAVDRLLQKEDYYFSEWRQKATEDVEAAAAWIQRQSSFAAAVYGHAKKREFDEL